MDKFDGVVLREKERSFYISRMPRKTKEEIIAFAKEEFEDDFGMCIHFVWNKFKEMAQYYENFDIKLNYLIELSKNKEPFEKQKQEEKPATPIRTMLSGRKMKGGIEEENGST